MAIGQRKQKQETINKKQFESLCHIQCTRDEICSVLNVGYDTLIHWCKEEYGADFSTVFEQKKQGGKASLRRSQWLKATEKLDTTMLIFLGKQLLGQKDKVEEEIKQESRITIVDDLPKGE